jgi:hypothetical protein
VELHLWLDSRRSIERRIANGTMTNGQEEWGIGKLSTIVPLAMRDSGTIGQGVEPAMPLMIGVCLAGSVQDMTVLVASHRPPRLAA